MKNDFLSCPQEVKSTVLEKDERINNLGENIIEEHERAQFEFLCMVMAKFTSLK